MMKYLVLAGMIFGMGACASRPVTPDVKDVKVSRENPKSDCQEVGKITGQTMKVGEGPEAALEDLKREAAAKGVNFVRIEQYSGSGTSVTATGFVCP